jgi:hypothetical protein
MTEWSDPRSACLVCKPDLSVHDGPGIPLYAPGVVHRRTCPTLPQLTAADRREWLEWCDELDRCRRRAMEASMTYVIGRRS